jgi:serine/threonine protein kinase
MALIAPGSKLGPYQIDDLLGKGGMGEVYRAHELQLGRQVAVKILAPDLLADAMPLESFSAEARVGALINHPNIVRVYDVGLHDGMPFIVSELLEGQTLRAKVTRGALGAAASFTWGRQITAALVAAHQLGIVHGDLKPENVFITSSGTVKVLDFGIAACRQFALERLQDNAVATWPHALLGTVGYMSPEQVRGQALDERADLFSVGAMLYEMASGVAPFRNSSPMETLAAILIGEPPRLRDYCDAPPELERIIRHCLEKDRAYRFQCARDLLFNLELASPGHQDVRRPARSEIRATLSDLMASLLR